MGVLHATHRRWSVEEYYRMAETGVIRPDERVELIDGEVVRLSPQDWLHSTATTLCTPLLTGLFPPPYYVRVQLPLDASPHSQPEPDFAIVDKAMLSERPHPHRPHLILEVAQSSLRYDREVKAHLYASMGVPEFWILNVIARNLEVYTQPVADPEASFGHRYALHRVETDQVRPLFRPEVSVPIQEMLPDATC